MLPNFNYKFLQNNSQAIAQMLFREKNYDLCKKVIMIFVKDQGVRKKIQFLIGVTKGLQISYVFLF